MKHLIISTFAISSLFLVACGGSQESKTTENNDSAAATVATTDTGTIDKEKEFKFQMIIAGIPSPAILVVDLAKSGFKYNDKLVNDADNASKYNTTFKKGVNYGVYLADMAYLASFSQSTGVLKEFKATRTLADANGIVSVFDSLAAGHFKDAAVLTNVDSVEMWLDQIYTATDEFLANDHRLDFATKILLGSWVESNYIILSYLSNAPKTDKNGKVYQMLLEQKNHITNIISLLKEYDDHAELTKVREDLEKYNANYEGIGTVDALAPKVKAMSEAMTALRATIVAIG